MSLVFAFGIIIGRGNEDEARKVLIFCFSCVCKSEPYAVWKKVLTKFMRSKAKAHMMSITFSRVINFRFLQEMHNFQGTDIEC